ncbi:pyridine nucleotide-disulfide oxidoreductase-domain-containing protein [Diaporthe sp. PMI_573]|nr:pyridine nucleotide-disulfide oxidoreductase-domain-containing protein [Diaporthaceae sp. PMI_573]KAH8746070.1 pyridine nucleotide-disulfide oxidoreductase-domain-containing protein [Diaporthaceae sp. PMI_573]
MAETINVDYLVIGAGAMGMAFVDTLLTDTEKTVAIVDRYARPSGHWTVAYPYVRLHQPSSAYGVNSRHLGHDSIDKVGWNKGLYELASRDEICAYYDTVMHQTFLPSGRVAYYPKHEYTGGREFHSILTGKAYQVGKETRIVDATYMKVKVPSMGPPVYQVAEDVEFVTPNDMASAARPYANYTVIGAGKTGIDACLWLLANGIDPARITWIMPRDSFLYNRSAFQPGKQFAEISRAVQKAFVESVMAASSVDDLLKRLVASQQLLQLDDRVWPTMFRFATISLPEFEQLKKIKNIVRQGHVIRISRHEVLLQNGSYTPDPDSLFVDCSADGLAKQDATAIFQDDKIRLQPVRMAQQVFSSAFIAHVEATYNDDKTKNKLCRPIPHPDDPADLALVQLQTHLNWLYWNSHPKTMAWLSQSRLDWRRRRSRREIRGTIRLTSKTSKY